MTLIDTPDISVEEFERRRRAYIEACMREMGETHGMQRSRSENDPNGIVSDRDERFDSIHHAAEHFGVAYQCIWWSIRYGTTVRGADRRRFGFAGKPFVAPNPHSRRVRSSDGKVYESVIDALGLPPGSARSSRDYARLSYAIRHGTPFRGMMWTRLKGNGGK